MAEPVTVAQNRMGSPFSITAYAAPSQPRERLTELIAAAYEEIARVEDLLTDFRPSPFNEINEKAGIAPVKVPDEVLSLIEFSQQVSRGTGGAFDISYAAVGMLWREAFKRGSPPSAEETARAREFVDYRRIEINAACGEVFLPRKGMRIGLGSIGKSYGVDRAFELLKSLGVRNFFVNGAGDVRVHAAATAPRPWRIGIKNPFNPSAPACGILQLAGGAVTTSGDYERYLEHDGKRYHHIIDARTGQIRDDVSSVTVLAPTAVAANACATAVMALGVDDGAEYMMKRSVRGMIIASTGRVIRSHLDTNSLHMQDNPGKEVHYVCR